LEKGSRLFPEAGRRLQQIETILFTADRNQKDKLPNALI
jgi:hypothetical protein